MCVEYMKTENKTCTNDGLYFMHEQVTLALHLPLTAPTATKQQLALKKLLFRTSVL
jgi:hypothetical protein